MNDDRPRALVPIVSCGIVLANFVLSTSPTTAQFAPLPMSQEWLYAAAFVCGFALAIMLDRTAAVFYGVALMALIAVSVFSAVLAAAALLSRTQALDVILVFAFQQSFLRFVFICALAYVGAVVFALLKGFSGMAP